jgi:glutathione reductase (NADPH)
LGRLGIPCTLVCRSRILRAFDEEVAHGMVAALERHQVRVLQHTQVVRQETLSDGEERLTVSQDGAQQTLDAQWVLTALGRSANTATLQLERAGIQVPDDGHLQVDDLQRTEVPHIYAVGDITHLPELTPVAIRAGRRVAHHLFDAKHGGPKPLKGAMVPTAVFGPEPLAAVGLTEAQAQERYGDLAQKRVSRFVPLRQARLDAALKVRSIIKVVYHAGTNKVLGMHMLGADAPEIMQGFAAAMSAGITLDALDETVALHPTQAEEFVLQGGP